MIKILFMFIYAFTIVNVFGQNISYNEEFHISGFGNAITVSSFSYNKFLISEHSKAGGSYYHIYSQIYDFDNQVVGDVFQVSKYMDDSQLYPSSCGLLNGGFVVCWEDRGQDGYDTGIYAQLFTKNPKNMGDEFRVNTYIWGWQIEPNVCNLTNGGFIICWKSESQDGNSGGIYAQIYNENGSVVGNEFLVNTFTIGAQIQPKVTGLTNGGFVITWTSIDGQEEDRCGIFAQVFNEKGEKIGNEFQVNSYIPNEQVSPQLIGLVDGGFVISWQSHNQIGDNWDWGIFAQRYTQSGAKVGEEFQVNSYTRGKQHTPVLCKLSNGGFIIGWHGQGRSGSGIYAKVFDEYGKEVGSDFLISGGNNLQLNNLLNGKVLAFFRTIDGVSGKYYLEEPINHSLVDFEFIAPEFDAILNSIDPKFVWENASELHVNFPFEITYSLYIDNDESFSNPLIITGIQDTTYQIDSLTPGKTYFWKVLSKNISGDSLWSSNVNGFYVDPDAVAEIKESKSKMPEKFELSQNYPNPFNPSTVINYSLPSSSKVLIKVYDILGSEIKTLVNKEQSAGNYKLEFNASNLPSGIYFYRIIADKYSETKKMVLMR